MVDRSANNSLDLICFKIFERKTKKKHLLVAMYDTRCTYTLTRAPKCHDWRSDGVCLKWFESKQSLRVSRVLVQMYVCVCAHDINHSNLTSGTNSIYTSKKSTLRSYASKGSTFGSHQAKRSQPLPSFDFYSFFAHTIFDFGMMFSHINTVGVWVCVCASVIWYGMSERDSN